jgi:serine/threonine protein kinase
MYNWLSEFFSKSRPTSEMGKVHLTFARTSMGRSLSQTGWLLTKQLWIWPIVAVALLGALSFGVQSSIQTTMEATLRSQLETLLAVEKSMVGKWFKQQESNAAFIANDKSVRQTVADVLAENSRSATEPPGEAAPNSRSGAGPKTRLATELAPGMSAHDFAGYVVIDKEKAIVASNSPELIGRTFPAFYTFLTRVFNGESTVCPPFASVAMVKDDNSTLRTGVPTMLVCVPVRDNDFQVIAVLAFRVHPEEEFTSILQLGRIGSTGETYAINKNGLMVSNSRFDESLLLLGLLPDQEGAASLLNIQVRDPGGNIVEGYRPNVRRHELPLTKIAATTIAGGSGVIMEPYRDYRGAPSVGAWAWLPQYEMGIITEIDTAEAFHPLTILRYLFRSLLALLGIGAAAIFAFTLVVSRLQHHARKAAVEAKQLGQYRLQEKLGAGAMGVVYKGQHAMLRRPTAIKMLNLDRVNEASIQRFEREVQITCKLNNPHTIAIYDFGRTPEGVFYYAMEYLDGIDLQSLVEQYGPLPEGRVVQILRQVCASLYEAHSLGLVHRDVKPANIMLNRRGAEPDVVKVLDFGLVKATHDDRPGGEAGGDISGTPLYMSPEAIQTPEMIDARSDLYAVGAVGYFLLTGQTPFAAHTLGELCQQHLTAIPEPLTQKSGRPISEPLEHAILCCLEKSRAKRPQTARDLVAMLDRSVAVWSVDDAESWWSRHERRQQSGLMTGSEVNLATVSNSSKSVATNTSSAGFDQTTILRPPSES